MVLRFDRAEFAIFSRPECRSEKIPAAADRVRPAMSHMSHMTHFPLKSSVRARDRVY
jgi:hypothetical protein